MRLKGKIALITAAGQGIGQAAALAMAAEGAAVYATDVNAELLKAYQGVANVHTAVLNVLDKKAITAQVASMDPSTSFSTAQALCTTATSSWPLTRTGNLPST